MRIYFDTEFWERGADYPIILISIGMVREDGKELYLVNRDAPYDEIADMSPWLLKNVLSQLPGEFEEYTVSQGQPIRRWAIDESQINLVMCHDCIANKVLKFCTPAPWDTTQLWAWYGAYDHVVLAQLFGTMSSMPHHVLPMWTNDLRQEVRRYEEVIGKPLALPEQPAGAHNALEDARWLRERARVVKNAFNEVAMQTNCYPDLT
jgi:hypothetical protein